MTAPEAETFGDRLQARLAAAGLSQVELAARLGVTKARAGELARAAEPPKLGTVIRLAEALGCAAADLDPRIAGASLPAAGSRAHRAAEVLEREFGLEVEFVAIASGHYLICRRPGEAEPAALVAGPNRGEHLLDAPGLVWGCLAPGKLQVKILAALNGRA